MGQTMRKVMNDDPTTLVANGRDEQQRLWTQPGSNATLAPANQGPTLLANKLNTQNPHRTNNTCWNAGLGHWLEGKAEQTHTLCLEQSKNKEEKGVDKTEAGRGMAIGKVDGELRSHWLAVAAHVGLLSGCRTKNKTNENGCLVVGLGWVIG